MGSGNLPLHNFRHIHILHGYQSSEVIQRANKLQLGTEFGTERKKGIGTEFGTERKKGIGTEFGTERKKGIGTEFGTERKKGIGTDFGAEKKDAGVRGGSNRIWH